MQYNQTFKFRCNEYHGKSIIVTAFDYDAGSSNDLIGKTVIDLSNYLDAEPDYKTFILLDQDKQAVKGHDKQVLNSGLRFGLYGRAIVCAKFCDVKSN